MDKLMYDDDEHVRAELMRITAGDPVGPFDGHRVVQKARKLRRRRAVTASSAAAAVTAVLAIGATLLAPDGSGESPPAGISEKPAVATATASPRTSAPSVPSKASMPSKPSKKVLPLPDPRTQADPRADDATVLKACSASLEIIKSGGRGFPLPLPQPPGYKPAATDLTGWRMITRSIMPTVGTVFIATSPDSELVAMCYVYKPGTPGEAGFRSTAGRIFAPFHLLTPYTFGCPESCGRGLITDLGRVTTKVVRFRLEAQDGRTVDVPVKDGWYALMWSFHDRDASADAKVTAYDADGRVVRPDPDFAAKLNRELDKPVR